MFELDDKFFEEIGLSSMPPAERQSFRDHVQEEIQVRVGERISDGMTLEKMEEFEGIVDNAPNYVASWVEKNSPNHREDRIFQALKEQNPGLADEEVMAEYASMKWLEINRPDFTQIVATVFDEMKAELKANADKILG